MKQAKVKEAGLTTIAAMEIPSPAKLLAWYDKHRRVMPWRALPAEKPNPYRVWLSEVMLQQTTVATVGPYFQKFIKRWPRLEDLAGADLNDVMRMWAGLGYYRRARLLHQCAVMLVADYGGNFPKTEAELLELPGFGPYTAAAVAAIAFDQPANVVDGNVERVMARIYAVTKPLPEGKPALRKSAAALVPQKRCGDYAQALMDLGATVCTPRSPKCGLCPWQKCCAAAAKGIQETLPKRQRKQARPTRYATAFVLLNGKGEVLLRQRPDTGLLAGMMEVPSTPWAEKRLDLSDAIRFAPCKAEWRQIHGNVKHVFSHFSILVSVAVATTNRTCRGRWVPMERLHDEALPSVMRKILRHGLRQIL